MNQLHQPKVLLGISLRAATTGQHMNVLLHLSIGFHQDFVRHFRINLKFEFANQFGLEKEEKVVLLLNEGEKTMDTR